jgi:hypothetical protein
MHHMSYSSTYSSSALRTSVSYSANTCTFVAQLSHTVQTHMLIHHTVVITYEHTGVNCNFLALSATIGNAQQLKEWWGGVRGQQLQDVELIQAEEVSVTFKPVTFTLQLNSDSYRAMCCATHISNYSYNMMCCTTQVSLLPVVLVHVVNSVMLLHMHHMHSATHFGVHMFVCI